MKEEKQIEKRERRGGDGEGERLREERCVWGGEGRQRDSRLKERRENEKEKRFRETDGGGRERGRENFQGKGECLSGGTQRLEAAVGVGGGELLGPCHPHRD